MSVRTTRQASPHPESAAATTVRPQAHAEPHDDDDTNSLCRNIPELVYLHLPIISHQYEPLDDGTGEGASAGRETISQRLSSLLEKLRQRLPTRGDATTTTSTSTRTRRPARALAPIVFGVIFALFALRDFLAGVHAMLEYYAQPAHEPTAQDPIVVDAFGPAAALIQVGIFCSPTVFLFALFRRTRVLESYMDLEPEELDLRPFVEDDSSDSAETVESGESAPAPPPSPFRPRAIFKLLVGKWFTFLYRAPERISIPREMIVAPLTFVSFAFVIRDLIVIWHAYVSRTEDSGVKSGLRFASFFVFMMPTLLWIGQLAAFRPSTAE